MADKKKRMNSEIARTKVPYAICMHLWAKSAGRCQMCNIPLFRDPTFGEPGNYAEKAHIHAVSPNGPRHKTEVEDINDISNLMLLCPEHHNMIDTNPENYCENLLIDIKNDHERRINECAAITDWQETRMVSYIAPIDGRCPEHSEKLFRQAIIERKRYPKDTGIIELNRSDLPYEATKEYYEQKALELTKSFQERCSIIHGGEIISLFAFGLQPILILLGTLFSDQPNIEVYQCHREGHKWKWKSAQTDGGFSLTRPDTMVNAEKVALVIDVSAEIINARVERVLSPDVPIYHIRYSVFDRNIVTHSDVQGKFIEVFRNAMEEIKNIHPSCTAVHIFPSMPLSLNVKLGMDYMPKADLPMVIYDQDSSTGGFFETITIINGKKGE